MPTYDYECDACGAEMEIFQGINEPKKKKCPECGKNKLNRLFGTGAAIVFKGSGFYQTDYRSEGYKKAAEADKKASEAKSADSSTSDTSSGKKKKSGGGKSSDSKSKSTAPKKSDS